MQRRDKTISEITFQTKAGEHHARNSLACEDVVLYRETEGFTAAALADGATGCRYSLTGAQCAAEAALSFMEAEKDELFELSERRLGYLLTGYIKELIADKAYPEKDLSEYGSTLLAAAIRKSDGLALLIKLGNGKCLASGNGRLTDPFMYRSAGGERYLTTDRKAFAAVRTRIISLARNDGIFMCTDGFERIVFDIYRRPVESVHSLLVPGAAGELISGSGAEDDAAFLMICQGNVKGEA